MKRIVSMMLTLCMLFTCVSLPAKNANADEVSASSLKAYMKEAASTVNTSLQDKGIAMETEITDDDQITVYVNDKKLSITGLIDSVSDLKQLFSYSGINSVIVKWNNGANTQELKGLTKMQIGVIFLEIYGLSTYDVTLDGYEVYKLSEKDPVTISLGLTTGESVDYTIKFTCLETYMKEASEDANQLLSANNVPMSMTVDNDAMKINVTITNASYAAYQLALGNQKDFLSAMFSYKGISGVSMDGEKAGDLKGMTLATLFIKKLFPEAVAADGSLDYMTLLGVKLGDLDGKKLTVKITLSSGQETSYKMTFTVQEPVTYKGKVSSFKAAKTTTTSVTLTWNAPAVGATGYRIVQTGNNETVTKTKTNKTVTFKSLAAGKVYTYKITAYKKIDGKKVYSEKTTTLKVITKPKKVTFKKVSSAKKAVKASWKKVTATGYEIQVSTSSKFTKKTTKTTKITKSTKISTTVKKLKAKKKYYVRVRAYKKSGTKIAYGAWSNKKTVKTK